MERAYRYRLVFKRDGRSRGLSHREQIKFFRNFLSQKLPVAFFNKKTKLAFGPAISVGYESLCEYVDIYLGKRMGIRELDNALSESSARGFELIRAWSVPLFFPSIEKSVEITEYEIFLGLEDDMLGDRIAENMRKDEILYRKEKLNQEARTIDLKKYVFSWKIGGDFRSVTFFLRHIAGASVKPEIVLTSVGGYSGPVERILRKEIYWINSNGELVVL